jgi:SAM-dependent methyltransferase
VIAPPERLDVAKRIPQTKEECEHYARYVWASTLVHGETLDVACGTGYGARLLARRAQISGVDRDELSIKKTRSRVTGTFLVGEVPPIPFSDDAFDFVVSFETVEHISDDVQFLREIKRVLRPGGELLISTPNEDVSTVGGVPLNSWHIREYTLESLSAVLEDAGLTVSEVYAQSFPPRIARAHRVAWRLQGLLWALPSLVRSSMPSFLGDAQVRPLIDKRRSPGYWVVRASA